MTKPEFNRDDYWRYLRNNHWEVGPGSGNEGSPTDLADCARDAAALLQAGETVHWMPGDGTNYMVHLVIAEGWWRYLAFLNASFPGLLHIHSRTSVRDWVSSSAPLGGWGGVRPLLVALGCNTHRSTYEHDVREEAKERADQPGSQYVAPGDAALGRQVRLLVQSQTLDPNYVKET
jgi:hypothetical protein